MNENNAIRLLEYIENKRQSMWDHDNQCDQGLTLEGYNILNLLNQLVDVSEGKIKDLDFSRFKQITKKRFSFIRR